VLTAGAIMMPAPEGFVPNGRIVQAEAHLETVLPLLADGDAVITVMQDGCVVGILDRSSVIRALIDDAVMTAK
jgi:predicted transcriptional regulator